ncbi:MAG: histidine kinase [Cellvibrio sp.]
MVNKKTPKYLRVFIYASIFWLTMGTLHLGSVYLGDMQAGEHYDLTSQRWIHFLLTYFTWAFLTTFIYFLVEKIPPSKDTWRWMPGFLITMFIWLPLIVVIGQYLSSILWQETPQSIASMLRSVPPFLYLFNALKFIMIYVACAGIFYYRNAQDAKLELLTLERTTAELLEKKTRFQLQALQSQLSPHFLFNALNSVSGMARNKDHLQIVETVAQLADLLRYAIEATNQTEVILEDELRFTANYIALQKIRFGDSFSFETTLDVTDSYAFCPPFCIQTLVENVFSHNELSSSQPVKIQAHILQDNERTIITITNSLSTPVKSDGTGTALRNLNERLNLLYGEKATFVTHSSAQEFSASITLPLRYEHD